MMTMNDAGAIVALRKEHIDAFNRRDLEGMVKMLSDDAVVMPPSRPALQGKEAVRSWWKEGFEAARSHFGFSSTELEIAGDWAFDRFAWTMETTPSGGGKATRDNGDCVWIWKKGPNGSWLLARAIWNSDHQAPGIWAGATRS